MEGLYTFGLFFFLLIMLIVLNHILDKGYDGKRRSKRVKIVLNYLDKNPPPTEYCFTGSYGNQDEIPVEGIELNEEEADEHREMDIKFIKKNFILVDKKN